MAGQALPDIKFVLITRRSRKYARFFMLFVE
jgi:hypothetical protein